jgi:hypothetical protein
MEKFQIIGNDLNKSTLHSCREFMIRLKSEYVCYYSVHNLWSDWSQNICAIIRCRICYRLLSKNKKIKIRRAIILPDGVKLVFSHSGKNIAWGCPKIGCRESYLGLRRSRYNREMQKSLWRGQIWSVFTRNYSGDKVKKNVMGSACGTYGRQEKCIQGFGEEYRWKLTTWTA